MDLHDSFQRVVDWAEGDEPDPLAAEREVALQLAMTVFVPVAVMCQ